MKNWHFFVPFVLQKLIWIPFRLLFIFCGHIEIKGLEHLKGLKTNVIFATNHSSEFDVFLVPGSLPMFTRFAPMFYTSRERAFYKNSGWRQRFYGGTFFKAWGAHPVYAGLNDYDKSLVNHLAILRLRGNLCIFPEGRRTLDGKIQEGKGGVAYLAYKTGRPIVPVYLGGTFRLSPADFFRGRRKLSVTYGAPIYITPKPGAAALSPDDFKAYANVVMDRIREMAPKTAETGA
ncbi:MAG: lysophospholipid acyltransferase family protein [Minisyncoccia bacterium]